MSYQEILANQARQGHRVSLGIDPDIKKIPKSLKGKDGNKEEINVVYDFLTEIISATANVAGIYKPNLAFFEQFGGEGYSMLEDLVDLIRKINTNPFIIADGKRGDIDNTNDAYMRALEKFDAFTIAPYLGGKANKPFFFDSEEVLRDKEEVLRDKLVFVLCQTSNDGAGEFQNLYTMDFNPAEIPTGVGSMDWMDKIKTAHLNSEILPLYQRVAKNAINWSPNVGLVTGAPYPENMAKVRQIIGNDRYLLIPGVGTQQGSLEASLSAGMNDKGEGVIVNVSRSALYASSGEDFAEACKLEIVALNEKINNFRKERFDTSIH